MATLGVPSPDGLPPDDVPPPDDVGAPVAEIDPAEWPERFDRAREVLYWCQRFGVEL